MTVVAAIFKILKSQNMNAEEKKQYRSLVETQLKEKETDIETTITYVTVGLLGLFLTINEKFIPFSTSKFRILIYVSVGGFVLSFLIGIINKLMTTKFDRKVIDFIDNSDLAVRDKELELLEISKKCDKILRGIRSYLIFPLLLIGLIAQIFYFFLNLNQPQKDNESIKIEIQSPKSDTTLKLKNTNVHIFQTKDTAK